MKHNKLMSTDPAIYIAVYNEIIYHRSVYSYRSNRRRVIFQSSGCDLVNRADRLGTWDQTKLSTFKGPTILAQHIQGSLLICNHWDVKVGLLQLVCACTILQHGINQ